MITVRILQPSGQVPSVTAPAHSSPSSDSYCMFMVSCIRGLLLPCLPPSSLEARL